MKRNLLIGEMYKHGDNQASLAAALKASASTLNAKLQGTRDFWTREVRIIQKRYKLSADEIQNIFLDD